MVRTAEDTARSAEALEHNKPGYCLQWCRERADIPPRYSTASTAWWYVQDKHRDHEPPRGSMVYWLGGTHGYGHIAVAVGGGEVRSTDADGYGRVGTRNVWWVEQNWHLPYAGWSFEVNGVTIPHKEADFVDEADWVRMRNLVRQEAEAAVADNNGPAAKVLWQRVMSVTKPDGTKVDKSTGQLLRETWSKLSKYIDKG